MGKFNKKFTSPIWLITIFPLSIGMLWIVDSLINILKTRQRGKKN